MRENSIYSAAMNKSLFYTRRIYSLYGFRKASYFWLQTQLHRKLFARWFDFIDAVLPPDVTDLYKIRLIMRPAFRFMRPEFDAATRAKVLIHHYAAFKQRFPEAVRLNMMEGDKGCRLAEIAGKGGGKYAFETRGEVTKEGVIRVIIIDVDSGFALALLAGIFAEDGAGRPVFYIGMLRGPGQAVINAKEMVTAATKDLSGLRPKQAVLHATAALAEWLGAGEIIAPSSENEIAMKNLFKGHKVLANHDPFWQEFAPEPSADGLYHLQLPLPRRTEAEVQQKRRKDWRMRYTHIDNFSAGIKNALDVLSGGQK